MTTMIYSKKRSLFGKQVKAKDLAYQELEDISLKLLHYQNEQMLVNKQVMYLQERQAQLRKQTLDGVFDTVPTYVAPYTVKDVE